MSTASSHSFVSAYQDLVKCDHYDAIFPTPSPLLFLLLDPLLPRKALLKSYSGLSNGSAPRPYIWSATHWSDRCNGVRISLATIMLIPAQH